MVPVWLVFPLTIRHCAPQRHRQMPTTYPEHSPRKSDSWHFWQNFMWVSFWFVGTQWCWGKSMIRLFPNLSWLCATTTLTAANEINGMIPSELGLLTELKHLVLANSFETIFTGTLPTEIGQLTELITLISSKFLFGWCWGKSLIRLFTNLWWLCATTISTDGNYMTGTLPSEIGMLTNLATLQLLHNFFTGTIPSMENIPTLNQCLMRKFVEVTRKTQGSSPTKYIPHTLDIFQPCRKQFMDWYFKRTTWVHRNPKRICLKQGKPKFC